MMKAVEGVQRFARPTLSDVDAPRLCVFRRGTTTRRSNAGTAAEGRGRPVPTTMNDMTLQAKEALNKTGVVSWYETTGEL